MTWSQWHYTVWCQLLWRARGSKEVRSARARARERVRESERESERERERATSAPLPPIVLNVEPVEWQHDNSRHYLHITSITKNTGHRMSRHKTPWYNVTRWYCYVKPKGFKHDIILGRISISRSPTKSISSSSLRVRRTSQTDIFWTLCSSWSLSQNSES
jgi:hypothetical protein